MNNSQGILVMSEQRSFDKSGLSGFDLNADTLPAIYNL